VKELFASTSTGFFVAIASGSWMWGVVAAFAMLFVLTAILEAADRIIDELRDAGVLPEREKRHAKSRDRG
jgi:hypothetical protein